MPRLARIVEDACALVKGTRCNGQGQQKCVAASWGARPSRRSFSLQVSSFSLQELLRLAAIRGCQPCRGTASGFLLASWALSYLEALADNPVQEQIQCYRYLPSIMSPFENHFWHMLLFRLQRQSLPHRLHLQHWAAWAHCYWSRTCTPRAHQPTRKKVKTKTRIPLKHGRVVI